MNMLQLQEKLGERMTNICNPDLTGDELVREIERSKAAASIAGQMVQNSKLIINAKKLVGCVTDELVNSIVSGS